MTIKPIEPHQQRVIYEKDELDKKIILLSRFLRSDSLNMAAMEEQLLLRRQLTVMNELSEILMARIKAWGL